MATKKVNVGLVGCGFMGRTHSNAFHQVNSFFQPEWQPVLKAVCARDGEKAKAFAAQWGYESAETDWRRLVARPDIDLIDIASPPASEIGQHVFRRSHAGLGDVVQRLQKDRFVPTM